MGSRFFSDRESGTAAAESQPSRRFTDAAGAPQTVIGAEAVIKGQILGRTNVELSGTLEGSCAIEGLFLQRASGTVHGDVRATNVSIEGEVEGKIVATQKVELRASCRVRGDIEARSVAIAEGSFFEGNVAMTSDDPDARPVTYKDTRGSQPPAAGSAKGNAAKPTE